MNQETRVVVNLTIVELCELIQSEIKRDLVIESEQLPSLIESTAKLISAIQN